MPYSGASDSSLPSSVKKMPMAKKKAWVATFNKAYKGCIAEGGSTGSCETMALKMANGMAKKKDDEEKMDDKKMDDKRSLLGRIFDGFLDSVLGANTPTDFEVQAAEKLIRETFLTSRATSLERVYSQIYVKLRDEDEWSYPMSLYVDDNGKDLFCLVAQSGKIFQVPISVSKDDVELGTWIRVEETFTPVEQSFRVFRQKDGKYRWTCIAGTTVLNRVGEIDSAELFDSFIEHAERTKEYPRLDFYHMGDSDPEKWEFGTADYLTREGVCYIASGTFDENHPLAPATIKACQRDGDIWGNSIEFRALSKPEIIIADPEVKVPVYKRGKNTRISLVLEEDAAGLFTLYHVEGVERTMDEKTKGKLTTLFGADSDELKAFLDTFEQTVDGVNKRVKDEDLIHRSKDGKEAEATVETEAPATENDGEIVLDDETLAEIAEQVVQSKEIKALVAGVAEMRKMLAELVVGRENDQKEITRLTKQMEQVGKEEGEKKTEYLQDLPSRRRTHITHRPRDVHDDGANEPVSMAASATRTLGSIAAAGRYPQPR